MNELVFKSTKGNPVTTSSIVAELFGKNHSDVLRDVRNLSCSTEFRESNFALMVKNRQLPQGGSTRSHHVVMTKDGFSFLVMGYTGARAGSFKESFIKAFNLMDEKLRQSVAIPSSFAEALELAAHQAREIEAKDKLIAIQAPKADYADRVLESDNQLVDI